MIPRDYNAAEDLLGRNPKAGRGAKTAFIDDAGSISFAELEVRANRFGNGLKALGIGPGDEVIVPMKGEDMDDQPEGVKCYDWFFCTRPLPKEEIEKKLGKGIAIKG